jgi:hypothetical protein
MLGFHKFSYQAQIIESLANPQALKSLSYCKVAMLKVRFQGASGTKQRRIHVKPKDAWKPIGLSPPQNKSLNS